MLSGAFGLGGGGGGAAVGDEGATVTDGVGGGGCGEGLNRDRCKLN